MINLENLSVYGFEEALRGMRNPHNSWDKSDSHKEPIKIIDRNYYAKEINERSFIVGPNDHELMISLSKAGTDHRKYMRTIVVYVDITAPLYWWKEFDTYKVGTVANSCSTMHKIAEREFTLKDFSHEHLSKASINILNTTIKMLNAYRTAYNIYDKYKSGEVPLSKEAEQVMKDYRCKKDIWWQMIQLLPSSYNQRRTIMLNYEVLANIYKSRRKHKLDEWCDFCKWIKLLPYSEIITVPYMY